MEGVIESHYFSSYKGFPVIKLPIDDNAFSFHVMFIGNDVDDENDIKHEYGHCIQYSQLGFKNYYCFVAVPSLICFWTDVPKNIYYSLPWEYGADFFGGVNREDYQYAENAREIFYFYYWDVITKY